MSHSKQKARNWDQPGWSQFRANVQMKSSNLSWGPLQAANCRGRPSQGSWLDFGQIRLPDLLPCQLLPGTAIGKEGATILNSLVTGVVTDRTKAEGLRLIER